MSLQQAALQALEALEEHGNPYQGHTSAYRAAITALRQALAEPVQNEPLAWFRLDEKTNEAFLVYFPSADGKDWRPLYAMPRKPLSEAMKEQCPYPEANPTLRGAFYDGWMRAEAAHGIGDSNE